MNEKKDKTLQKVNQHAIQAPDADLMQLADKIVAVIEMGRQQLAISINQVLRESFG